jgi:uncharacterized membrane protein YgcG
MFGWLKSLFGSESAKLDKVVASLVERSRAGDQNATSVIMLVGRNRFKNQKAAKTYPKLKAYIKAHPVKRKPLFGGPENPPLTKQCLDTIMKSPDPVVVMGCILKACRAHPDGVHAVCVALANGPALNALRLTELASAMNQPGKETAFRFGVEQHHAPRVMAPPPFRGHMSMGQVVGRARGMQIVRGGGPIVALSPPAAVELGDPRHFGPLVPGPSNVPGLPPRGLLPHLGPILPIIPSPQAATPPASNGGGGGGSSNGGGGSGGGGNGDGNGDNPPDDDSPDDNGDGDDDAGFEPTEEYGFYSPEEEQVIAERSGQSVIYGPSADVFQDLMKD